MSRRLSMWIAKLLRSAGYEVRRASRPQRSEAYIRTHEQLRREVAARKTSVVREGVMPTIEQFARDRGAKITPLKHAMMASFEKRSAEAEFLLELDRRGYQWNQTRDGVVYAHFTDDPERLALYRKSAFPSVGTVVVQTNP